MSEMNTRFFLQKLPKLIKNTYLDFFFYKFNQIVNVKICL